MSVTLSDGSSFFVLKEVQLSEAVYPGAAIDADERERLQRLSQVRAAVRSALGLLARAPHSQQALRLKLVQRGHEEQAIVAALERARELGYLDDGRFAEDWLRQRLDRHPEGRAALVAGLRERGVARDVAEQAVARMVSDEVEEGCLLRALGRAERGWRTKRRTGAADTARLCARLRSLGFPDRLIRKHLPGADAVP